MNAQLRILKFLQEQGPMSTSDLAEKMGMSGRTVRHAVSRLLENQLVRPYLAGRDQRYYCYGVR